MTDASILWRRLDQSGHEAGRLVLLGSQWHLTGGAVFTHNRQPCLLDYRIVCDSRWHTLSAGVVGWIGDRTVEIELIVDSDRHWLFNGAERPAVAGCIDLDLNFSPSTNLLPIRRLGLAIGEEAEVRAAWLRFPSLSLEPLEQRYRRVDAVTYRYESGGGRFTSELRVNAAGFVTRYPDFCHAEAFGGSGSAG